MCLAYPGKIKSIKGDSAQVDFDGIEKEVNISLIKAKKGDYVMVHAGFAIEKIDTAQARQIIDTFQKTEIK